MKAQKVFDNKIIGYAYFLLEYNPKFLDKKIFVTKLVADIRKTTIGFAGFERKKHLERYLRFQLFDDEQYKNLPRYKFAKNKIFNIIKDTLTKCHSKLSAKPARIFLFPNFNSFVKNRMGGVSGFSPRENTILIDINPTVKEWETNLKNTICHEYNHSVVYNFHKWNTLLDNLIFEGLAEHFREQVIGGKRSPWVKAVSQQKCRKYFSQLEGVLNSKSHQLYREVFFGSRTYPLWLGYSLGYYIVYSFLNNNKEKSWEDIVKIKPKEILEQSSF